VNIRIKLNLRLNAATRPLTLGMLNEVVWDERQAKPMPFTDNRRRYCRAILILPGLVGSGRSLHPYDAQSRVKVYVDV
jgi:hypothetical protein